ncbi:MAG: POT family MFS transporter [Verrucomicrobiae bacterium]|nr:POT family MFS transporter [Verrucomicrobiae bacterium]NNJ42059.1 POT family MFS transporter [Akkermansiaceae bacterium]
MHYRTSPSSTTGMPSGIPHIVGNETAERFSFYGMKAVLAVFMIKYLHLMNDTPGTAMTTAEATEKIHTWVGWVYLTPFFGALLADIFLGKYRTIIILSLVYCVGHAALAFMGTQGDARWWMTAGLMLIALGSGGIKPCVSAHVGDQFGPGNSHLLAKIFNWFYFSINLGAMLSALLTPWLMEWYGPHLAFGVPGVLMALATLVFWMGRNRFIHVPAGGMRFLKDLGKKETWKTLLFLAPLYLFLAIFWSLFDQTGTTLIFQAQDMDRNLLGTHWLPSQLQSLNSLFVLAFIPIFTYLIYPAISKIWKLTPLRKIGIGLFVMVIGFSVVAVTQTLIDSGQTPNIIWQVVAYALLTSSEVMVSIVALEFAYTQAPRNMKSLVMCFYLGSVAVGNFFTAGINNHIQVPAITLEDRQSHAGFDQLAGTSDDITLKEGEIHSPCYQQLKESADAIKHIYHIKGELPSNQNGSPAMAAVTDPWGNQLRYTRLNSRTARISSDGPDQQYKTQWDLGVTLTLPEPPKEKTDSWADTFRPDSTWLERRKQTLGLETSKNVSGDDDQPRIQTNYYAGGGSQMEGASYFWFFTKLMLATAIIFIPYAIYYKKDKPQDDTK